MWPDIPAVEWGNWIIAVLIAYSAGSFAARLLLAFLASDEVGRQRRRHLLSNPLHLFESDHAPAISILLPARDEAGRIVESVRALLALDYPALEVVVANDGSTDDTLARLIAAFDLRESRRTPRATVPRGSVRGVYASPRHPGLVAIDVARGGSRARAASLALAYARHPLVLVADPDTVLERETLVRLALPFYEDDVVEGVMPVVRPSNGCVIEDGNVHFCGRPASRLARFQVVEHLRGALSARLAWSNQDSLLVVPGPLGLFSADAVRAVGGFRGGNAGNDVDLCMRLQRRAAERRRRSVLRCVGDAVVWARVPESSREFARRRTQAHQALAEALWFNRALLLDPRLSLHHGFGYLFHLALDLVGPVIEAAGQIALVVFMSRGDIDISLFVIYFSIFIVGGTVPSLMAIGLERSACPRFERQSDLEGFSIYALIENLGYRQVTSLFRFAGLWRALWGTRPWSEKPRRGRAAAEPEPEAQAAA